MTANVAAVKFLEAPLSTNQAQPKKRTARLSDEEKQARAEARRIEREAAKLVRAQERAAAKERAYQEKIAALEGGDVQLPAVVLRDGTVFPVNYADIQALLTPYLDGLCLDVETTGYQLGHRHYALRTIQLGGEGLAVVLDADEQGSLIVGQWALRAATRLHAFSASADIVPVVDAGLIGWDEAWAKMVDGVQLAKLTDPAMAKSKSEGLKALSLALHGAYAVSPGADDARKALFAGIKCLTETNVTTPVERSGWAQVKKSCKTMTVYAGSDVLDLAATVRVLYERLPVSLDVLDRECQAAAMVAPAAYKGFPLDLAHIQLKIAEYEKSQAESKAVVAEMTGGAISNPSSSKDQVLPYLLAHGYTLKVDRKSKELSAGKPSLEPYANRGDELCRNIIEYRHCTTTLGLLLRPLENLCTEGDAVMRPTVYTLEAKTGRMSCVRPNGQQFSRQGGIRACVRCAPGYLGISADFSGCEILVAAALSGDRDLYEAETGPRCHRCGEFAYEDEGQACACGPGKAHKGLHWLTAHTAFGEAATKENRYQAKRGTFTRLFGGGPPTAADQVGCDVETMQQLFVAFNQVAPAFTAWDQWLRQCYKNGSRVWRDYSTGKNWVQDIEGHNRMTYVTYSGRNVYITNGEHAAGNGAIQGTARELLVDGLLRWKYSQWGGVPVLPVHDQLVATVKEDEARAATTELARCMTTSVLSSPGFEIRVGVDVDEPFVSWPDSS